MNALLSLRWLGLAGLLIAVAVTGCGKAGPKMAPVSGTVTVDGVALTAGQVSFIPVGKVESSGNTGFSGGTIDATGKYTVFTGGEAGAPLGKYKATVNPSMVPMAGGGAPPAAFNDKFRDAKTSTLEFEVVDGAPAGKYDLKLTKK